MLDSLRLTLLVALTGSACSGTAGTVPTETGSTSPVEPCATSTPILLASGASSGFEQCNDGAVHRTAVVPPGPVAPITDPRCSIGGPDCAVDADCTEHPAGACLEWEGETLTCQCYYGCTSDSDCGSDQFCMPPEVQPAFVGKTFAQCHYATCVTDADCPSGECTIARTQTACGDTYSLACRSADDACRTEAECEGNDLCFLQSGAFECRGEDSFCGRPLRVDGVARMASVKTRTDWSTAVHASVAGLSDDARRALAEHWAAIGRLEHASIASFARVTLQLLALGAPSELVADTQAAAGDEVRHARLAFGLASVYAGRPLGPGPIALGDAMPASDPAGVLRALVDEACVGEVLGAAEAGSAAAGCTDPIVAGILAEIAADEARHAALAWRTLRWLVERWPELRSLARVWLAQQLDGALAVGRLHAPESGALGGQPRADLYADVREQVVRPLIGCL